jgi:formate dehydrogenase major subunit
MTDLSRRDFLKVTGVTLVGSSLAALGFSPTPALAEVRQFKLARATETRNTCTYCSVACGILMYSLGDGAKNAQPNIFHIEGDPDHPVNRGTCARRAPACSTSSTAKRACSTPNTARRVRTSGSACPGMTHWIASPG